MPKKKAAPKKMNGSMPEGKGQGKGKMNGPMMPDMPMKGKKGCK